MMLWKCYTQYASTFGKLSSGHKEWKRSVFIPISIKGNAKECSLLGPTINTTLAFNTAHRQLIYFNAHKRADPSLFWQYYWQLRVCVLKRDKTLLFQEPSRCIDVIYWCKISLEMIFCKFHIFGFYLSKQLIV